MKTEERIASELLALLCCPVTRQALRVATDDELRALRLDAALVRDDGRIAYPIRDGIPVLIAEEGIALGAA
jgi:uncharacterized protein YbaR (Trm112 family)